MVKLPVEIDLWLMLISSVLHSSYKPDKLLQQQCHYNSTVKIVVAITITSAILPHRKQWISPSEREWRAACGTECISHVVAAVLMPTMATCERTGTGCWYGAEDDCKRVFTTSSGHVITAPTVPPTLQQKPPSVLR